ncbi:MAG: WYL domain-containing protein [Verrucomicrobiota bacterium]
MTLGTGSTTRESNARAPIGRFFKIHTEIRRNQYPNCTNLSKKLGVTKKTIQRDITYMQNELDLPLVYDKSRHGYFYNKAVQDFPMFKATSEDIVALFLARKALEPLKGTPLEAQLGQSFRQIAASMQGQVIFRWTDLDQAFSIKEPGVTIADVRLFEKITDAVLKGHEIRFDYKKLGARKKESRHLQPYHLTEVDGGWYVVGFDLKRKAKRTFAFQRITGMQLLKSKRFVRPDDFELSEHLSGFGVWENTKADGGKYKIRIRFSGWAAQLVSERRWHPSQNITQKNKNGSLIELSLELGNLKEVTRWILSWGGQAKVLAPKELKAAVKKEVAQMVKNCG